MLVRDVMSEDVLKVNPDDNAYKVGSMMDDRRVSAVVVVDDNSVKGIVSKETFVSHIDKLTGGSLESMRVYDFMEADIDTIDAGDELKLALDRLLTQKTLIDRMPVLDDGEVVGWVSKIDFTHLYVKEMKGRHRVGDLMHYNPETVFDYTPLNEIVDEIKNLGVKRIMVLSGETLVGIISVMDLSLVLFRERNTCQTADPTSCLTAEDIMTRNPVTIGKKKDAWDAAKMMVDRSFGGIPVVDGKDSLEGIITRTDLMKGYQLALD